METPGQGRERPSQAYLPSQHANHAGHTFLNLQTPTSVGNQLLDVFQYLSFAYPSNIDVKTYMILLVPENRSNLKKISQVT